MNYRTKLDTDFSILKKLGELSDRLLYDSLASISQITLYMSRSKDKPDLYHGSIHIHQQNLKDNNYSKTSAQIRRIKISLRGLIAENQHIVSLNIDTEHSFRVISFDDLTNAVIPEKILQFIKLVEETFIPLKISPVVDKNIESLLSDLHAARDAISSDSERALNKLTNSIASVHAESIERIDEHIRNRDIHFRELEDQHRIKIEEEQRRIAALESALNEKEASLNLKEPVGERRRIHNELRQRLITQIESFKPSKSVNNSRILVRIANYALIGASIYAFVYFATHLTPLAAASNENAVNTPPTDLLSPSYILSYLKVTLSAAAAFAFSVAYIRWEGRVADRLSETEFRIRDKAVDIERSAWIVETVEAMTSNGKQIPDGLIPLLGHNLFVNGEQKDTDAEKLSSFLQHLVGKKGTFETHLPGGGSVTLNADGARPKTES